MNIEIIDGDLEHLIFAIECRLRAIGKTYENSLPEDCEIAALKRFADQCGVQFEFSGGNTGFVVHRHLQQAEGALPRSPEDNAWLNAPSVGRERVDD